MNDGFDIVKTIREINLHGFYKFYQPITQLEKIKRFIDNHCNDTSYLRGANWWPNESEINEELKTLICDEKYKTLFKSYGCILQDICVTREFNSKKVTRNNYLHFDRLRSMKVLVYLEDVCKNSGPFTVCPGTTKKGAKIRRSFAKVSEYEEKKNRIEIDYPELEYELFPILGPAGTTVIFDSDTFHKGGHVSEGKTRAVIRSHWYKDNNWRIVS